MIMEVEIPDATTRPTPNTRQSPFKTLMRRMRMPFLVMMVSSLRRILMILEMLSFHHNGKSFVLNLEVKGASGFGNLNVANTIVWLVQGRNSDRAHYWILKSYLPLQNKNCMNYWKMKTTTYQRCRTDQGCCPRRIQAEKSPRQADQAYEIKFGLQGFAFV